MTSIRLATVEDAPAIRDVYAPYVEDTSISFEYDPPSTDEVARRIESTTETHPWLVYSSGDDLLGYAYAGPFSSRAAYRWTVEVSAYVESDHRGGGVGRALYESLLAVLPGQGFVEAYAGIALPNERSVGFHESMGFDHHTTYPAVGYKFGEWLDVGWWRRPLRDRPEDPEPPLSTAEARAEPWWDETVAAGEDSTVSERD